MAEYDHNTDVEKATPVTGKAPHACALPNPATITANFRQSDGDTTKPPDAAVTLALASGAVR